MKKILLSILCCLMFGLCLNPIQAGFEKKIIVDHEEIKDGEFTIEIITYETENVQTRATSIKKGGREYLYRNAEGQILWTVKLTGTFEYNGSTSKCLSASVSVLNISSGWKLFTKKAFTSGNQAKASVIMREISTMSLYPYTITLSCSPTGIFY